MEDETLTSGTTPVEGDVVQVTPQSGTVPSDGMTPAPEPSTPYMEPSTETIPKTTGAPEYERVAQIPQTEKTLAETYVDDAHANSYLSKGHGISDWIKNEYNYDQREAGTMWVAGKINDVATQMSFLEATLNEDMYSELDLQRYFFDTNLATARAYAKEKKHETAYGYYRAATEKALAEGDLIGWYMPAEANYMLSQWAVAGEKLKDPNISVAERNRAGSVREAVEGWFNANNITWRGIECLNRMYYQETVRHNMEMERLQGDANKIAAKQANANAAASNAAAKYQLRLLKFQNAELELQRGLDFDNDNIIGHNPDAEYNQDNRFQWYSDIKTWAENNLQTGFTYLGQNTMKNILGNDFGRAYTAYKGLMDTKRYQEAYANEPFDTISANMLDEFGTNKLKAGETITVQDPNTGTKTEIKIDANNNQLKILYEKDGHARLYIADKEGRVYQITDDSIKMSTENKEPLKDVLKDVGITMSTKTDKISFLDEKGNTVEVSIGPKNYSDMDGSFTNRISKKYDSSNWISYNGGYTKEQEKTINEKQRSGWHVVGGAYGLKGSNTCIVMEKDGEYFEVDYDGTFNKTSAKDVITTHQTVLDHEVDGKKWVTISYDHADGSKLGGLDAATRHNDFFKYILDGQADKVGYTSDGYSIYELRDSDGNTNYVVDKYHVNNSNAQGSDAKYIDSKLALELVSDDELIKLNIFKDQKSIDQRRENVYDYAHGIKPKDVEVQSLDAKIKDEQNNVDKSTKKELENFVSSSGYSSETRNVSNPNNDTKKSLSSKTSTETSDDEVIIDNNSLEVADAELGKKATEEIEKNKERYNNLFGVYS